MRCALCCALTLLLACAGYAADTDKDGLADDVEKKLGSDPQVAETMAEIGDDGDDDAVGEAGQALDVGKIYAAHVAGSRWLFKITFVGATDPAGKQISLYLDADNNKETGRQDKPGAKGSDIMYTYRGETNSESVTDEALKAKRPGAARYAFADGALYVCDDLPLGGDDKEAAFRFLIISSMTPAGGKTDGVGWLEAKAPRSARTTLPAIAP